MGVMDWTPVPPSPNLHVETLPPPAPRVAVFGDEACKGLIKVKWGHEAEALNGLLSIKGRPQRALSLSLHHVSTQWEDSRLKARKKMLMRTQPRWHSDLRLAVSRTVNFCCPSRLVYGFCYGSPNRLTQ